MSLLTQLWSYPDETFKEVVAEGQEVTPSLKAKKA
jgi:hypothetical protein